MRTTWHLWAVLIAIYILNIGIVAINGGTLINNIVAWACCIVLTISLMLKDKLNKQYENLATEQFVNYSRMKIVHTLITLQDIREKLQGNEETIKVVDEEIERLEKEL